MSEIPNKEAKNIVSLMGRKGFIPVGAYGRTSKDEYYNDLDFIYIGSVSDAVDKIPIKVNKYKAKGDKYIHFETPEKYNVDVWIADNKDNFYKLYLTRTLPKYKIIYINKLLKRFK